MDRPAWLPAFVNVKNALIFVLSVSLIVIVWVSWWNPKPVDVEELTKKLRADIRKEFAVELANSKKISENQNVLIKDYRSRLLVSVQKVQVLESRIKEMANANSNRVPPKTNEDIRKRLGAFGITAF